MSSRFRLFVAAVGLGLAALVAGPARVEAGTLSDDGRVGAVTDLQGTAFVRPAGYQRWSPAGPRTVLLPGDDLRTPPRGANAVEVRLADGGTLVVGPGAEARLESRTSIRVVQGDAEIAGAAEKSVAVSGPGGFAAQVTKRAVVRTDGRATSALDATPPWLQGYRASTTDEWMGSLLAKVDGRNVPLTVGYHKVDVTIRDQIAETVVEESFQNSTDSQLEGVFTFPLPAGASIAGFGMWIGDELVEADIVERDRARAIYEDIKSRKKDPGLLEWSGGNLFTANVFPIFAHSEKRVRVRYTQVLPLEGQTLRYRYALRSEMLRTHPLRELRIHVAATSSLPIASVTSATHEIRTTRTDGAAVADFSASEVTPDRDFEVAFQVGASAPLRVVPHVRGEDGYFALFLSPPDPAAGAWKRDLLPDGDPLDLVFLLDTSGSMGPAERGTQRAFLQGALALLGPNDRFRVAACDAGVTWLVPSPQPATDANIGAALETLDRRWSLGWSDLDTAVAAAASKATKGTLVVYVGDGIGTTGDADPVALAKRIEILPVPEGAQFHAVSVGSAYEEGVLQAMASHGGAVRAAGDDPAAAAFALLAEVAQPAARDLRVEFEGLRTAKVYPEKLPVIAAGTQQIVLGRFLPTGSTQRGTVTVTGSLAGQPVRWTADVAVEGDGAGNSFLPRLWARRHLDALLAQGRSAQVKAEIVSFSERFGILTPYTSLLVLENDDDRARYGVARRVQMRDGERFFTDARATAQTAALREAMRAAGSWRAGLRTQMLREIADLGRGLYARRGGVALGDVRYSSDAPFEGPGTNGTIGIGGGGGGPTTGGGRRGGEYWGPQGEDSGGDGGLEFLSRDESTIDREDGLLNLKKAEEGAEVPPDSREPGDPPAPPEPAASPMAAEAYDEDSIFDGKDAAKSPAFERTRSLGYGGGKANVSFLRSSRVRGQDWIGAQLFERFPGVGGPLQEQPAVDPPEWNADVTELLRSVSGTVTLAADAATRLELTWTDVQRLQSPSHLDPTSRGRALVAPDRWFLRTSGTFSETYDQWTAGDRGILAAGTRLGRRRPRADGDLGVWAPLSGVQTYDFVRTYTKWTAKLESREGATAIVRLTAPAEQKTELLVVIDTEKHVVTELRWTFDGKPTGSRKAEAFVQAAGRWWPTTETQADADGKVSWRRTWTVRDVATPDFDAAFTAAMTGQEDVLFLGPTDPTLRAAKQHVHDGKAEFADHLVVAADHAAFGRFDDLRKSWDAARALAPGKPGLAWIGASVLSVARAGEEFAAALRTAAAPLPARKDGLAPELARIVDTLAQRGLSTQEQATLLDLLEKTDDGQGDVALLRADFWRERRAVTLTQLGRHAEVLAIRRALWDARPDDLGRTLALVQAFLAAQDLDGALAFHAALPAPKDPALPDYRREQVASTLVDALWNAQRFAEVLTLSERRTTESPSVAQGWQDRASAWLALGRIDDFDRWVAETLASPAPAQDDRTARAKLQAAVFLALGNDRSNRWWGNETDPQYHAALAAIVRRDGLDPASDGEFAQWILQDWRFRQCDAARDAITELRARLTQSGALAALDPNRVARVLAWFQWNRNSVDAALWRTVTDLVAARWRAEKDPNLRQVLVAATVQLLDAHTEPEEAIRCVREELGAAKPDRVPGLAGDLLNRLLAQPWSQEREDEAFALVPRLVSADPKADVESKRWTFAWTARHVVDRLSSSRMEAGLGPKVEQEKLSRAALREHTRKVRAATREALHARLGKEVPQSDALLRPWYEIERLCLAAELGRDAKTVEAEARELLLSSATASPGATTSLPGDDEADEVGAGVLGLLRTRCVLVLSHVAVRSGAPEGLADRVLQLLGERMQSEPETMDWRYAIFRLLVTLDRAPALEASLREWIVPAKVESRWRIALGYLLAETNRLGEAASQFEEVVKLDELPEAGYVALANWYLVLGDDVHRGAALDGRYRWTEEWQLQNRIWQERSRVQSGPDGVPQTMDDEILRVIRVLLMKSQSPQQHLWVVRELYSTTKDRRLLASIADGVIGHSPEQVYGFLGESASVIGQIHEEASCDEMRARLDERLSGVKTDTDRRALRLLAAQCERRAGEVLDQPGPHTDRALAELRAAKQGAWLPGERRMMADYLAALANVPSVKLADEQRAQLRELHAAETPGGIDRLRIAYAVARTEWGYGHAPEAIQVLADAIEEHRVAQGGSVPAAANDVVDVLTTWLEQQGRFRDGEAFLVAETARQPARAQREWYERRTFWLWQRCLERGADVALGKGESLYRAAKARMEKALGEQQPDAIDDVVQIYCALHRAAHGSARVPSAVPDLVAFSRGLMVELLPRFGPNAAQPVSVVAETLTDLAGPKTGLTLLVEQLEREPDWRKRRNGYAGWGQFGYRLGEWRRKSGALGDLEQRLLAVVLREEERDLSTQQTHNRALYGGKGGHEFWSEKADAFAQLARKVLGENAGRPGIVLHVAQYLWNDLRLQGEAIDVLAAADLRGALREDGRWTLVSWLVELKRFREALPHAERLVRERPDNFAYAMHHIRSLHGVSRDDDGRKTLAAMRTKFDALAKQGWNRITAQLADLALECEYADLAEPLYDEAISDRRRATRGRTQGDWEISRLYGQLSHVRTLLGKHDLAVDAAAAAIVAWGPRNDQRAELLGALQKALQAIPDLQAWTAKYEAESAASGTDAPVIRRALAAIHLARKEADAAIRHLLAAQRFAPDDVSVAADLVSAYEMKQDDASVCDVLAASLGRVPRQPELYEKLAARLAKLQRTDDAERALTGLAEFAPNEPEGHRLLALARQKAKRAADAVIQWRQVVRTRPSDPEGWYSLARALASDGKKAEAHAVLDDALQTQWGQAWREGVEEVRKRIGGR